MKRCLDCWRWALPGKSRCAEHQRGQQQAKDAQRPTRRTHAEQQRRRQQVTDQPWCLVCGTTIDLTAEHVVPVAAGGSEDGALVTLCRHHNSSAGATVRRTMTGFS